jgi:hypothetical protein
MNANEMGTGFHRRSQAKVEHLVLEYKQSGQERKEFCAAHGLRVHTLDAWRRRIAGLQQEIVPVEIVEDGAARRFLK